MTYEHTQIDRLADGNNPRGFYLSSPGDTPPRYRSYAEAQAPQPAPRPSYAQQSDTHPRWWPYRHHRHSIFPYDSECRHHYPAGLATEGLWSEKKQVSQSNNAIDEIELYYVNNVVNCAYTLVDANNSTSVKPLILLFFLILLFPLFTSILY